MENIKKAPEPHVLFQQILGGEIEKALAGIALADEDEKKHYGTYKNNNRSAVAGMMIDAAIASNSPLLVKAVIAFSKQDPKEERSTMNAWCYLLTTRGDEAPKYQENDDKIFEILAEHGKGKEVAKGQWWSLAHQTCSLQANDEERALQWMKTLKKHGYDLDQSDEIGETPLMIACWQLLPKVVQYLLDEGADITKKTLGGRTIFSFLWRGVNPGHSKKDRLHQIIDSAKSLKAAGYPVNEELNSPNLINRIIQEWNETKGGQLWSHLQSSKLKETLENSTKKTSSKRKRL